MPKGSSQKVNLYKKTTKKDIDINIYLNFCFQLGFFIVLLKGDGSKHTISGNSQQQPTYMQAVKVYANLKNKLNKLKTKCLNILGA